MKWFKRNNESVSLSDKAACGIANKILQTQRGFTHCMQSITKGWKKKQQWIFLYLVCLGFGTLSITAIVQPFKTKEHFKAIAPKAISVPKSIPPQNNLLIITKKEFEMVRAYKQAHPDLIKERPGLYDSLNQVEEIYYSQQK
ncbi:MAG: hypothetical protein ABI581_07130 [Sediminibacterium sp.]